MSGRRSPARGPRRGRCRAGDRGGAAAVVDAEFGHRTEQACSGGGRAQEQRGHVRRETRPCQPQGRVAARTDGERAVGEAADAVADRGAFRLVRLQQLLGCGAAADVGEFPAQVECVLDTGVHALSPGRAVDVRRVAGEEERTFPVVGGAPVVDAEARHPDRIAQRQLVRCPVVGDPLEKVQGHVVAGVGSARRVHRDHAPGGRSAEREEEQQPGRGHVRVGGTRLQSVGLQIRQQERLRIGVPLEGDSCLGAHGAVRAVAADDMAGAYGLLGAVPVSQAAGDVLALRFGGQQLRAPLHRHVPRGQVSRQHGFRLRLREEQQEGVRRVVAADVEHRHVQYPSGQMQVQPDGRVAPVHEVVRHAERGQHLQGAGLDRRGA